MDRRDLAPRAACAADAKCQATALVLHSTWAKISGADTFTAFTVVVVSNTVKKTASESTIWRSPPPDFVPPRTNAEGKKVETVRYVRVGGAVETTTVAFPNVFYAWNGEYVVDGQVPVTTGTVTTCLPVAKSTFSFPGNPQPASPRNSQAGIDPGPDVLGWGYTLQPAGTTKFFPIIDLLPNPTGLPLSAVKGACEEVAPSYAAGASPKFDAPWLAVGARQTVFVGEKDADTPATKLLTQPGISKVTATPTPVPPGVSLPTGTAVVSGGLGSGSGFGSGSGSGSGNGNGNGNNGGNQNNGGNDPSGTGTGSGGAAAGTGGAGQGGGSGSGSNSGAFALRPLSVLSALVVAACIAAL